MDAKTIKFKTIELDTPIAVETVNGYQEFADKDRQLRKTKRTIVDGMYDEFMEGLRSGSSHAIYLGNRAALGNILKDRLKDEGFNPICSPLKDPKWIAVELGG